jgi:hypothetical protein
MSGNIFFHNSWSFNTLCYINTNSLEKKKEDVEINWPYTLATTGSKTVDCFGLKPQKLYNKRLKKTYQENSSRGRSLTMREEMFRSQAIGWESGTLKILCGDPVFQLGT